MHDKPHLILASESASRKNILKHAGVPFVAEAAEIDEFKIKNAARKAGKTVEDTAIELAVAKATKIAEKHKDALVLGADQMLECDGKWMSKAKTLDEAKEQLKFMSAKTHRLVTAAALIKGTRSVWKGLVAAKMTVRKLSDDFIDDYVKHIGDDMLKSVGCYALEGRGIQLFDKVEGDFFGILGLPVTPLLKALRAEGILKE